MKPLFHRPVRLSALTVLSVTAACVAAVSACVMIFATVYSKAVLRDAQVNVEQTVAQTAVSVENSLNAMKYRLSRVAVLAGKSSDAAQFGSAIAALTDVENDIFAVTVYDGNGGVVSRTGSGEMRKETVFRDLSFDKDLFAVAAPYAITKPHVQTGFAGVYPWVVTMAMKTDEPVLGNGVYVAIDFRFSEIAGYMDGIGIGSHGYCFILNRDGSVVYHPQQQMLFSGIKSEDTETLAAFSDGVHIGKDALYALHTTADAQWRIVGVSYTEELETERRTQIVAGVAAAFLCCAAFIALVLVVYSKIVNAPVQHLVQAMQAFEAAADPSVYTGQPQAVTELQALSDSFSHMSRRIDELMEKVRREEKALRKTELRALQAQINPHFLYNTLDSIQWMCEQGKTEDASKMVGALARLFRISISRGHELITIKDELQHAKSYLIIQSYRYRNQFSYRFDVDETLLPFLCNKITIQPLIENAIYHGIDRMVDEGEIVVTVRRASDAENDILITVSDNGVGMTEEQCAKILSKERSDSGGIGVKNVNDRLKIYFGERYGLSIHSVPDEGTTVTVRIPQIEKEAEQNV